MSQSIRISSGGLVPILQRNTSSSSSCMEELGISNLSVCSRKRATAAGGGGGLSMVSKRNHNHPRRLPFLLLPCAAAAAATNVDDDEGYTSTSTSKDNKYDDPPKAWRTILSNFRSEFGPPQVTKRAVELMIRMDLHDPIDGLTVLLDVSRAWRMILSFSYGLYNAKEYDDHYGNSYLRKARMKGGGTNKQGKHNKVVKNHPSRNTTKLSIIRLLADLNDPNYGLKVLLGALELWRTTFSSNELNDSEGYLQKEIFAIHNLSHRLSFAVSSQLTHVLAFFKLMIDDFEDPDDALKAMSAAFRCLDEGVECGATSGSLVAAVAKLKFDY